MYISVHASTFNTKFNIQIQKATWTTQTHTLLPALSLNVTSLDHLRGFLCFSPGFYSPTLVFFLILIFALFCCCSGLAPALS